MISSSERKILKPLHMEIDKNTENYVDMMISYHL
jgi:hypothetical protein